MATQPIKILISGGGIAGSCLAFWLNRTNLNAQITIIERSQTPRVTGQAVDIREQAIEIIKLMGLEEAILDKNTTETGTAFVDGNNKIQAQFDADGSSHSSTSEYEILRADLADIFLNATKTQGNVDYIYGESIESLSQDDKGVTVSFQGGRQPETFDVLVGADGLRSRTRTLAFDPSIASNPYYRLGMYVAYFSIPREAGDTRLWFWYNAPGGRGVMLRPHKNPKTMGAYLCLSMPNPDAKDPAYEKAMEQGNDAVMKLLRERFHGAGWQTERILNGMETATDFYSTSWDQVRMPKWTNGRVALIGDAASATPGIGTSYAIMGAYFLAGELSKINSSADIPAALERFETNLRPLVQQTIIRSVFSIMNPHTSWGIYIRNTIFWLIWRSGAISWFRLFGGWWDSKTPQLQKYEWAK